MAGIILLFLQLVGSSAELPQVMSAKYSTDVLTVGQEGKIVISMNVRDGYVINRIPPIQLKLEPVGGLRLDDMNMTSSSEDPKSTDSYYVDVPTFDVDLVAVESGSYEIAGELVYFFCSKADGFCARQTAEVNVPVVAR